MNNLTNRELMDIVYRTLFAAFVYRAFSIVYPGTPFQPNWHVDVLCEYLQAMVEGRKPSHLVVNQPPRSLKTFIIAVALPTWILIRRPSFKTIVACYGDDIARDASRNFRRLVESDFVQRLSLGTFSDPTKFTENEFETQQSGGRFATSVGGTLTGRGADLLIVDDPIKAEDAYSENARDNAQRWFDGTALSRRNKPGETLCIVSMQRLHENDLAGYLIARKWDSLVFPLWDSVDREYDLGGGLTYYRPAGELLQPNRGDRRSYEQTQRQIGSAVFSAQYLQAPLPAEGNTVKRDWMRYYESPPDLGACKHVILACDPSAKAGSQNDYTAIAVLAVKDRDVYVLDVVRGHYESLQIVGRIRDLKSQYGTTINLIETTGMGESVRQYLETVHHIDVKGVVPKGDKEVRLSRVIGKFEGRHILLPKDAPWLGDFERELFGFPNTRYDDQIDALIMALEDLVEREENEPGYPDVTLWSAPRDNDFWEGRFTNRGY